MTKYFLIFASAAALTIGCTTTDPVTGERYPDHKRTGALAGAVTGAIAGLVTGGDSKKAPTRAAIGAGIGSLAGLGVGYYMDLQYQKLNKDLSQSGVQIQKQGHKIHLTMPADITFHTDSANITPQFYQVLNDVSETLIEFPETTLGLIGHADSRGSDNYNQVLSEHRATNVGSYLIAQGVFQERLHVEGKGEFYPIAPNSTMEGRAQNRRVELVITPDEQIPLSPAVDLTSRRSLSWQGF